MTPTVAVKFVAQCMLIFLFASVRDFGYALALALFCGMVYARQNLLTLAPAFIAACCVFNLDWWSLLYSVTPAALLVGLYLVYFKLRRNVPIWAVALAAFTGMIPYMTVGCVLYADYITVSVAALIAVVMSFCSCTISYAIFVRGSLKDLAVDEVIAGGVLVFAAGYALGGVEVYGFCLFYTALAFTALFLSATFRSGVTLTAGVLLGVGMAAKVGGLAYLGVAVLISAVAIAFSPFTRWASGVAILVTQGLLWLLSAYQGADWRTLIMMAAGVAACLCIPGKYIFRVRDMGRSDDRRAYQGIVNRRGRDLAGRLQSAGEVFYEMSKSMENMADSRTQYTADRLATEVARSFCGKCPDKGICFQALGGDTREVIKDMAQAALDRGKVTILDMPPFITSRCSRMHSLAQVMSSSAEAYAAKRELEGGIMMSKKLMSEQFAGMALVLDSLASNCAGQVRFCGDDVEYVKSELLKHNIVASELVVAQNDRTVNVTALVREQDVGKAILPKLLSTCLRTGLEVSKVEEKGDKRLVYLENAPVFEIAYGVAEKKRDMEGVSGDSRSILCPSRSLRLFAICDGMGSGDDAAIASRSAIGMIESFYRAGFDSSIILGIVNKLLKLSLEDSFSSMDIAIVDTYSGALDVIKLGAASSFIVRREGVETLSCSLPPVGILDTIRPLTSRSQLYDGDMLVMMSDGVFDALESKGVMQVIDSMDTVNPQMLADGLLERALSRGAEDDCTVLVLRMFAV